MNTRKKPNVGSLNVQSPTMARNNIDCTQIAELKEFFTRSMSEMEGRLSQRLGELAADIGNLRSEYKAVSTRVDVIEKKLAAVTNIVGTMQVQLNKRENDCIASDIIIHNMPAEAHVDVVVDRILDKLDCSIKPVRSFRVTGKLTNINNKNKNNPPVIVKFATADDRVKLFRTLAAYKKKVGCNLKFKDIELNGDGSLAIHECLTPTNRAIMKAALQLKANKKLSAVFSLRGFIFVRVRANEDAVKILHIDNLQTMVGAPAKK